MGFQQENIAVGEWQENLSIDGSLEYNRILSPTIGRCETFSLLLFTVNDFDFSLNDY